MYPSANLTSFRSLTKTSSMLVAGVLLAICFFVTPNANGQSSEVTGAIEGKVTNSQTNAPVSGAAVQVINLDSQVPSATKTGADGSFVKYLPPGRYKVIVRAPTFKDYESDKMQRVDITVTHQIVPLPISLEPLTASATVTPPTTPTQPSQPGVTPTAPPTTVPSTTPPPTSTTVVEETNISTEINTTDARRGGGFRDKEVSTLPLGGTTLTRSFDELALLLPGVAPPPQTLGGGSGPGVGAGVGSAGQFAVNGLRSRANNFTVDGSDNNDEDIGVRRQGFFSLVPQPIESIQEFRVISALAPAQYGRNFGAQVNAVSKSGGNKIHGTVYGLFNSDKLNSRNFFDTTNGNGIVPVRSASGQSALDCTGIPFSLNAVAAFRTQCVARNTQIVTLNQSDGEDKLTLAQGGIVLGGPIKTDKTFFFFSYERQVLNATKEASFAVPTLDQRGIFNTGATGLFADCLTPGDPGFNISNCTPANSAHFFPEFGFPNTREGNAVFSLFPFPNNPNGVYGANTFTETLPASARGNVLSGKIDHNFKFRGMQQTFTARYNFTQDRRDLPVTGGALFSTLQPRVRTQNFSTFLNSELTSKLSNVLRVSYGRTHLVFDEVRDPFLIPSQISPNSPFLLNAPRRLNRTLNPFPVPGGSFGFTGVPNTGPVLFETLGTTECGVDCVFGTGLGRVGQINVAGFSPIGVDVNNFPQRRTNNTYQVADALGYRRSHHSMTFGADIRRIELNSDLPRNARTLLTFNGAPEFDFFAGDFTGNFIPGRDFAAAGAPSGSFLSLANGAGSGLGLRYHEYNLFGQDEWRIRSNMSLSLGVRFEHNTPPSAANNIVERTFSSPQLNNPNAVGLKLFLQGRTRIFDPTGNDFSPRIGFAWSPHGFFGRDRTTIRVGFGRFQDQILGAVVSQSRNVFPNLVTVNTSGFVNGSGFLSYFNPARGGINIGGNFIPLIQPGTLNTLNPALPLDLVLDCFSGNATGLCTNTFPPSISATLPGRRLKTPNSEQYTVTWEQQLTSSMVLSVGYVGTRGHSLLRSSTPNLGPNNFVSAFAVFAGVDDPACFPVVTAGCNFSSTEPSILGFVGPPGSAQTNFDRPVSSIGPVFIFDSGGGSHYDALQIQMRGRFRRGLQYQANYTFSHANDDASDVFDLAGSSSLPQNSLTRAGEFAPSNFDAHHRFAYSLIYDFPSSGDHGLRRAIFKGLQFASTGYFQTGQPFTINSLFDVNLDGNLTDRINNTSGLVITGDRRQPVAIAPGTNLKNLLAGAGSDGSIERNSFRAGNILNLDLSVVKRVPIFETRGLVFRMDVFNFINRANFGIPVRFLEAPSFGQATDTVTPGRRIQFAVKLDF